MSKNAMARNDLKEVQMIRKLLVRVAGATTLCAFLAVSALAQYGGGGGMGSGGTGGTYTPPKGGYSSTTGIAVGAAAAAGVGLLYMARHKSSLLGCVEPSSDGMKLMNEKDKKTYALVGGDGDLKAGERVELKGKRAKGDSGNPAFHVLKLAKDYGPCTTESATHSGAGSL
jgi:hypothetical protein